MDAASQTIQERGGIMAYRLTEEMVYKIEHEVMGDCLTTFEADTDEERARIAVWKDGVRDMACAVINAIRGL